MALSGDLERLLASWLPRQSWFPKLDLGGQGEPDLTPMSVTQLFDIDLAELPAGVVPPGAHGTIQGHVAILAVGDGDTVRRLVVPLSYRTSEAIALRRHLIGTIDHLLLGPVHVYDGVADPVLVLSLAHGAVTGAEHDAGSLMGRPVSGPVGRLRDLDDPAALMTLASRTSLGIGEERDGQTTVVLEDETDPLVVSFHRILAAGTDAALMVPTRLTRSGSASVPEVLGWVSGRWFDVVDLESRSSGLAIVDRIDAGTESGWTQATRIAESIDSGTIGGFNKYARDIGTSIGRLHADLAAEFGLVDSHGALTREWVDKWRTRVDWALARAPLALSGLAAKLKAHRAELERLDSLGPLQKVHGELTLRHLATSPSAGYRVLDFAHDEHLDPRPPAVDLVAVLRSIDYVAGHERLSRIGALAPDARPSTLGVTGFDCEGEILGEVTESPEHLWSSQAQNGLLTGYGHARGTSVGLEDPVLRAVLVDRLLVEIVTELRNRPTWLIVPLSALALVLGVRPRVAEASAGSVLRASGSGRAGKVVAGAPASTGTKAGEGVPSPKSARTATGRTGAPTSGSSSPNGTHAPTPASTQAWDVPGVFVTLEEFRASGIDSPAVTPLDPVVPTPAPAENTGAPAASSGPATAPAAAGGTAPAPKSAAPGTSAPRATPDPETATKVPGTVPAEDAPVPASDSPERSLPSEPKPAVGRPAASRTDPANPAAASGTSSSANGDTDSTQDSVGAADPDELADADDALIDAEADIASAAPAPPKSARHATFRKKKRRGRR